MYNSNPNNIGSKSKNSMGSLSNKIIKSYHNKKFPGINKYLNENQKLIFFKKKKNKK